MKTSEDVVSPAPGQAPPERPPQAEGWRLISEAALSHPEQLILYESLVYALPPRAIQARHPDQFSDVAEIYRIKLGLFQRLLQDHGLQQLSIEAITR
jgi:hypothetical protein